MEPFQMTSLWSHLSPRDLDPHEKDREWLRTSLERMRDAAGPLANEIARSAPEFTDHSLHHIDALWETGSLIAGEKYPTTPAEVFVLGCAFILHDLGMGLAAYPQGVEAVQKSPAFQDTLSLLRDENPDLDESALLQITTAQYLRRNHAKQAATLMETKFEHAGKEFYLLEDSRLRNHFGRLVGLVAESHWYDTEDLQAKLGRPLGASGPLPREWGVNPIKLALLLRLADACHLDSQRAPLFLHTYRRPTGTSQDHWTFQERMTKPVLVEDRLEFTSTAPFSVEESSAWWVAYDSIRMVDVELRRADSLLADLGLPRLKVRGVAGVGSPARFAEYIQTANWTPLDASLRVTRVPDLVQRLGGSTLYGEQPLVAVRELISNAADAVRARRTQFSSSGSVTVALENEGNEWRLRIRDDGIGMTAPQMVQFLTDFGNSQWTSQERLQEFPGLAAKGYRSTGRFGIGFFASFIAASKVRVRSVPHLGGARDTNILEFPSGLKTRPLIRAANQDELLDGPGTEVTLHLTHPPLSESGLFQQSVSRLTSWELLEIVLTEMCFLLDVDLFSERENGERVHIIKADEWKTMEAKSLYERLYLGPSKRVDWWQRGMYAALESVFIENLEDIRDDEGEIVGRAALAAGLSELVDSDQWWWPVPSARVYVGGMKTDEIYSILGVLAGEPKTADRMTAFPIASPETLKSWAASQAERCGNARYATPTTRYEAGQLAMSLGIVAQDLPCAFANNGLLAPKELIPWIADLQEIFLIPRYEVHVYHDDGLGTVVADRKKFRVLKMPPNCLVVDPWTGWLYPEEVLKAPRDDRFLPAVGKAVDDWDPGNFWHMRNGSAKLVLEAASSAWNLDIVELGMRTEPMEQTEHIDNRLALQTLDGSEVKIECFRIFRSGERDE